METKELKFKKVDGTLIENVEKYVKDWAKENPYGNVIIGCDGHTHGRRIKYVVAIVMHYIDRMGMGSGAHVIIADIWEKRSIREPISEMTDKLWKETQFSLLAAQMVDGNDETFRKRLLIHLDFSPETKDKSNTVYAAGIGFLSGMGYKAVGKPLSYVATHTSDAFAR